MFCPECGSLAFPDTGGNIKCPNYKCGYVGAAENKITGTDGQEIDLAKATSSSQAEERKYEVISDSENVRGVLTTDTYICPKCDDKHYIFGNGGAKKISEQFKIPFLGEIPLNYGIMSGSDSGKPIMNTNTDSPSAEAFRASAKNVAAQCSIIASNLQEEMESESGESESSDEDSTNNGTS